MMPIIRKFVRKFKEKRAWHLKGLKIFILKMDCLLPEFNIVKSFKKVILKSILLQAKSRLLFF